MGLPPGLKLYRKLLSSDEIDSLFAHQEFQEISQENPQMFRLYGNFGTKEAHSILPWMQVWGQKIQEKGIFSKCPNQYRICDWIGELSGNFNWHTDNKHHGPKILIISLTPNRAIGFRLNAKSPVYRLELEAGDAYLMSGASRWQWEHRVLPTGRERSGGKSFILSYKNNAKK